MTGQWWQINSSYDPQPDPDRELEKVLVATPVEGWRDWTIDRNDTVTLTRPLIEQLAAEWEADNNPFLSLLGRMGSRLGAIAQDETWDEPTMQARCVYGKSHEAPDASCTCGFWAVRDEASLGKTRGAYGRVAMWGRVVEYAHGWRAQYAKPIELWLPGGDEKTAETLRSFYGCPVTVEDERAVPADSWLEINRRMAQMQRQISYPMTVTWSASGTAGPPPTTPWWKRK